MMCRDKSESDDDPGDVVHDGHGGQDGGGELFGLNGGGGARDDGAQSKGAVQGEHKLAMVVEELEMMVEMIEQRVITWRQSNWTWTWFLDVAREEVCHPEEVVHIYINS